MDADEVLPEWSTACPDWEARLRAGQSLIPLPLFPDEAAKALAVMRELRIVDAPGSPKMEDACGQWVFDLAAAVFGAYHKKSGRRLITEFFVMLPKKNFKSGLAASIMLTALIRNWRQSAEFTILAPTVEVATNSFNPARDMVQFEAEDDDTDEDDKLSSRIQVQTHIKTLTHLARNATLKVIAADENSSAGKKSVGTIVEELWLFGKQAKAREMLREALGGLASRPEGFVIWLTTQSDEPPTGVFKEKLQYARDVRDGIVVDPQFLPIIYEHPTDIVASGGHLELENMPLVNPNLGFSVDHAFLQREYRKAKAEGQSSFIGFMAKHANVEVGMALRSDAWVGARMWMACKGRDLRIDDLIALCEVVTFGIDIGGLDDLLGACAIGRERGTGKWLVWTHAWIHPIGLERHKQDASKYEDLERTGNLTVVATPGDDVTELCDIIEKIEKSGLLERIGFDQHGAGNAVNELLSRGFQMDRMKSISQGFKLGGAIKTTERLLAERVLEHGGTDLMAWCASNARVEPKGNSILITRQASGSGKIDPLMAMFSAVELMSHNPAPRRKKLLMFSVGGRKDGPPASGVGAG